MIIESEMNLHVNIEEHEMINVALNHLLDASMEMCVEENERTLLLKRVRDKSYQIWAKRFPE